MTKNQLKKMPFIQNVDLAEKKVIVRLDLNVPVKDGKITNFERINGAKQTLNYLMSNNCKIIILSHFSRIKSVDDINSGKKSLKLVVDTLKQMYPKMNFIFVKDSYDKKLPAMVNKMTRKDILVLENTRYNDVDVKTGKVVKLESKNDPKLAKFWASLADVFVNDAFATIHRGHASNAGIAKYIKKSCIGFLVYQELEQISKFNSDNAKPIVSIVGGAKISDKIILLEKLMKMSNQVLIGGGMAFTFLKALGVNVGASKVEKEMFGVARKLYHKYQDKIVLPIDALVANKFEDVKPILTNFEKIKKDQMCLDIGFKSLKQFLRVIKQGQTFFWNGPTGVFEFKNFSNSTKHIAKAIAKQTTDFSVYSLIGGGDTAAAACKFAKKDDFSWVSTGGGATLSVIQGDKLPGLAKIK